MDPITQAFIQGAAGAAGGGTYVDEVFNTKAYIGNVTERTITTGIDLAGEGGLLWFKNRDSSNQNHYLNDTTALPDTSTPWYSYPIFSNLTSSRGPSANGLKSFNSDGFTIQTDAHCNGDGDDMVAWSFRKAPGFFDVVTWTGNATARTIPHSLGCVPGMIIVKRTNLSEDWTCYHRGLGEVASGGAYPTENEFIDLNKTNGAQDGNVWNGTLPTSTHFSVGTHARVNGNNDTYVAYLFAGGESPADHARSVSFDGSNDYINLASSSDLSLDGDFTIEFWFYNDVLNSAGGSVRQPVISNNLTWGNNFAQIQTHHPSYQGKILVWDYNSNTGDPIVYTSKAYPSNQWHHVAIVRSSNVWTIYVDGTADGTVTNSSTFDLSNSGTLIGHYNSNNHFDGKISNLRVVKGTAVYTSSFNPPTKPLTNITNTKLLCCQNSTANGSTVSPGTIFNNGATASTDSPFDDPEGFKFGEGADQNIVKCGRYIGNAATPGVRINLGWEPQWVMVKRIDTAGNWLMLDSIREWSDQEVTDAYMQANNSDAESHHQWGMPYSRGMQMDGSDGTTNTSEGKYIYIAIRAADGLVGKPPEAGTEVFAMDVSSSSSVIPNFTSGFPVESALLKRIDSSSGWNIVARSMSQHYMLPNTNAVRQYYLKYTFDSSYGWSKDEGLGSSWQSWMWKRNAGMEVVSYQGDNNSAKAHSLGKAPEMMWVKASLGSGAQNQQWKVYHKGLNGGTNPEGYYMRLDAGAEGSSSNTWNNTAPSASHFFVSRDGNDGETNYSGFRFIAFLFASVNGISKVGSYTGSSSELTITTGFQPRFVIIKNRTNSAGNWTTGWFVFDTRRGWAAGNNDKRMRLNDTAAQSTEDWTNPISTGFTINDAGGNVLNNNGEGYIYYAHA